MSKQLKGIIAAAIALAVIVGAYIAVRNVWGGENSEGDTSSQTSQNPQSEKQTVSIYTENSDDLESVTITAVNSGTYNIKKSYDGSFKIPELDNVKAEYNSGLIDNCVATLSDFKGYMKVEDNAADLSKYGLSTPKASGTVNFKNGNSHAIDVGDETDDGYFYVTIHDSGTVYKATTGIRIYFVYGAFHFCKIAFFACSEDNCVNIDKFDLNNPDGHLYFELVTEHDGSSVTYNSKYVMREPFYASVSSEKLEEQYKYLSQMGALEVVAYANDETLAEYGLDKPQYTLSFDYKTLNDSGAVKSVDSYSFKYAKDEKEENMYVLSGDTGLVYRTDPTMLAYLDWNAETVSDTILISPMLTWVDTLTVSTATDNYVFKVTSDGKSVSGVSVNNKEIDLDNFKMYYQVLVGTTRYELVKDAAPETAAELTVTYTFRSDKERETDVVKFYPVGNRKYYAEINGKIYSTVLKTRIDKILVDTVKVLNGEEVTSFMY